MHTVTYIRRTPGVGPFFRFFFQSFRVCLHGGGGPQISEVTCGGSLHLTCKRDQIKMRHYMDRRVTPPKRVTSPTLGPPLPCKQALNFALSKLNGYLRSPRQTDGVTLAGDGLTNLPDCKNSQHNKIALYVTFISLH